MTVKRISCSFLLLMLCSCASSGNYERAVRSWLGAPLDALVASWGPPASSYPLSKDRRVVEYDTQDVVPFNGSPRYVPSATDPRGTKKASATTSIPATTRDYGIPIGCTTRFIVNGDGIIVSWNSSGDGCVAPPLATKAVPGRAGTFGEQPAPPSVGVATPPSAGKDHDKDLARTNKGRALRFFKEGLTLANDGKYQAAVEAFDTAIHLNPGIVAFYLSRADSYINLGKYEQAIDSLTTALKLNNKSIEAYVKRAEGYGRLGEHRLALSDLRAAAKLGDKASQSFLRTHGVELE